MKPIFCQIYVLALCLFGGKTLIEIAKAIGMDPEKDESGDMRLRERERTRKEKGLEGR